MPATIAHNELAWNTAGVNLSLDGTVRMTVAEALAKSGLDWTVSKRPAYCDVAGEKAEIPGRYVVQRDGDDKPFGVVGKTWQPVQNNDGFQLIDEVIAQAGGRAWIQSAGELDGGKKVWVLAHVDSDLQIAGEDYVQHILFINGHDGRCSVTAAMADIRFICSNMQMLDPAIDSGRIVRVRHTTNATSKIAEAAHILGLRNKRAEELAKQGEWLVDQTMSDGQFAEFLESLMPVKEGQEGKPSETMALKRREQIADLYFDAPTCAPLKGTRWGAYQAVLEYGQHKVDFKNDDTRMKAQSGLAPAPVANRAFRLLTV
jgi:phage/plasmid-like protein (TIGR03299 family)